MKKYCSLKLIFTFIICALFLGFSLQIYAQDLIVNGDFENGTIAPWEPRGEITIDVSTDQAHSGKYSLYCHDRSICYDGAKQNLADKLKNGSTYKISGWIKMKSKEAKARFTIEQQDGKGTQYIFIKTIDANAKEWKQISGIFVLNQTGDASALNLYPETESGTDNFYIDDITVEPWLTAKVDVVSEGKIKVLVNTEGKKKNIPVYIKLLNTNGKEILKAETSIGKEAEIIISEKDFLKVQAYINDENNKELIIVDKDMYPGDLKPIVKEVIAQSKQLQLDPEYSKYFGWLNYLTTKLEKILENPDATADEIIPTASSLKSWADKIEKDKDVIEDLNGVQEWAYLSKVDNTGQPFLIVFPEEFNHKKTYALNLMLHGATLTHAFFIPFATPLPDRFQVYVMGRSRHGGYFALSEVDILEVLDYVGANWKVDPDRIHVEGQSMGGGGTFKMASRYPDLFSSASPQCAYGIDQPVENAINVPFLSLHSKDDYTVPVSCSRIPLNQLDKIGGRVLIDETDGLGHAVWDYKEGLARNSEWSAKQVRVNSVGIRRVKYTAMDELARKAYWVEVAEWGPENRPASIDARLSRNNSLYITLDNVDKAIIDLSKSPAEKKRAMSVIVNKTVIKDLEPPLPKILYVSKSENKWLVSDKEFEPSEERPHFPGGAMALFHGEPIMVVWGTGGDIKARKNIYKVAQIARRSCNPSWPKYQEVVSGDPMAYSLFGMLPGKPDMDITEDDMQKYNLIIIGTPEQNIVADMIKDHLPVKIEKNRIRTNDDFSWKFTDRALGLLYYNPFAPKRLIYWVASDNPESYKAGTPLMEMFQSYPAGADFIIAHSTDPQFVAARCFTSRWNWQEGYKESEKIRTRYSSMKKGSLYQAKVIQRATGANFTIYSNFENAANSTWFAPRKTKKIDLEALNYYTPLLVMEITGKEILEIEKSLETAKVKNIDDREKENKSFIEKGEETNDYPIEYLKLYPSPKKDIEPNKIYKVSFMMWDVWSFVVATETNPETLRYAGITFQDALKLNDN